MKGFFILFNVLIGCFGLAFNTSAFAIDGVRAQEKQTILILKSKESSYYNKTINAIKDIYAKNYSFNVQSILNNPTDSNPNLVITLGESAARYSRINYPNTFKILSYLNLDQSLALTLTPLETHILIELKTMDYLDFAKAILPNKKIGVLYQNPLNSLLRDMKDQINLVEVTQYNKVLEATRNIIKTSDMLLALPNKNLFNRHTLKGILLSTYQNRTPLISYSPAHAKAGAVAAIYASPINIGQHISDIIIKNSSLNNIESSRQFAKKFSIKINHRVAQSLGLRLNNNSLFTQMIKAKTHHE